MTTSSFKDSFGSPEILSHTKQNKQKEGGKMKTKENIILSVGHGKYKDK